MSGRRVREAIHVLVDPAFDGRTARLAGGTVTADGAGPSGTARCRRAGRSGKRVFDTN